VQTASGKQAELPMASSAGTSPSDVDLSFASHNPEGRETILLIHGAFSSRQDSDLIVPLLTAMNYHLLVPDLPSHGESIAIRPFHVDRAAELLLSLIQTHAHNGKAHIVGFSLGAHVAASLAALGGPEHISSVLATGFNTFLPPRVVKAVFPPFIYTLPHALGMVSSPAAEWARLRKGEGSLALCGEVVRTLSDGRVLKEIHVRSLVVAATREAWLPKDKIDSARQLFRAVAGGRESGSRVVQCRRIWHGWCIQEPQWFADTVDAWVRGRELAEMFEDIDC
jgi:pimeloyl-ACP methyl ester carboxylesterase